MTSHIRKAVIPAAGIGTRLLSATKEMPKEMLPIFARGSKGSLMLKPVLQLIFEQLYEVGFREFCFIVGRGKRAIEDHFSIDTSFLSELRARGKGHLAHELERFYDKVSNSTIIFINQPEPKGFGDAILRAKPFTSDEAFLVHAGDDLVLSSQCSHLRRLLDVFKTYKPSVALLIEEVADPRAYGVVTVEELRRETAGIYRIIDIVEKPAKPPSNLAVIAIYVLTPVIYDALKHTKPDATGEIQLTDAIRALVVRGELIVAVKLRHDERRIDVGTPRGYWKALCETMKFVRGR